MKKLLVTMILVILMVFTGKTVWGVEKNGVYLSPPYEDISVDSSHPEDFFYLTVGNNSSIEESFDISVVDFGSLDETGGVAFLTVKDNKSERKYALASWVSLEKNTVTVASGKSEKIKITILNKDSLTPGGHYGAVLATLKSGVENKQDKVGVNQSLASLIYVQKSGGAIPDLKFNRLEFNKNVFYLPRVVKLRFGNNGNIHVVPRGKVEIVDSKGQIVAKGIINADSGKVLPESFRILEVPVNRVIKWDWPGIYNMEVDYRYDGRDNFSVIKKRVVYIGFEGGIMVMILSGVVVGTIMIFRRKKR